MHQGAKADLIYGVTGASKTSRIGDIAEYVKRKYNKPSRLVSASPGGWQVIESLVHHPDHNPKGIIQAFALIPTRKNLYEAMDKLTQGWWPKNHLDPQSDLLPPEQNGIHQYGGMYFEDCTSFCEYMMRVNETSVTYDTSKNILVPTNVRVPEMPKDSYIRSGDYVTRFLGRSDYGGTQGAISSFIWNSGHIPVDKVAWTALETTAADEKSGRIQNGPEFTGNKATFNCGPWFGNFLHLDLTPRLAAAPDPLTKQENAVEVDVPVPLLWLRTHYRPRTIDPYHRSWPAKTRAPKSLFDKVPAYIRPDMGAFYDLMEQLQAEERKMMAASGGAK